MQWQSRSGVWQVFEASEKSTVMSCFEEVVYIDSGSVCFGMEKSIIKTKECCVTTVCW